MKAKHFETINALERPSKHSEPVKGYNGSGQLTCSHFGCGRKLSLVEQMAGSRCTTHMTPDADLAIRPVRITEVAKRLITDISRLGGTAAINGPDEEKAKVLTALHELCMLGMIEITIKI